MSKQDAKFMAGMVVIVAAFFLTGFVFGYIHVIIDSEAYCVDNGDTLVMVVDGHEYHYVTSPKFYERSLFSQSAYYPTDTSYGW